MRHENLKHTYAYKLDSYWSDIASVKSHSKTNMDLLRRDIREYLFRTYPEVYVKINDSPSAEYNPDAEVRNSLISSGCVLNGWVENSILFWKMFIGQNYVTHNSVTLNDVYIRDDAMIEDCIIKGWDTPRANMRHIGTPEEIKITIGENERYVI